MVANAKPVAKLGRPRVLIVEPDGELALATIRACLDQGLEPEICLGADDAGAGCPGAHGEPCDHASDIAASLISITSGRARRAAPACAGERVVLAGGRPLVGKATETILESDALIDYPYLPEEAADLLSNLVNLPFNDRLSRKNTAI